MLVSFLLASLIPDWGARDGLVTLCDMVAEAIVVVVVVVAWSVAVGEALITRVGVESIKLVEKVVICGTKEESDIGRSALRVSWGIGGTSSK